jgi:uncharacterized protein YceH (UPF0502 family)
MKIELTAPEARVIGALLEKQITTPDQYPLSLNALLAACNQKSNREPVMSLTEPDVQQLVDALSARHLVVERSGFGSRVSKYQHRLCNTEAGTLKLDPQELAILTELLLRGPQTPGELRSRAGRMASFADASEVEAALGRLAADEGSRSPLVVCLPREPGRREARYAHLLSGPVAAGAIDAVAEPATALPALPQDDRIARLEEEVRELRAELAVLKERLGL